MNAAKTYADTQDTATLNAAKSYADAQDVTTLNAAKTYADTQDTATLNAAKSYADAQDATNLAAAKTYADTQDAANLVVAKSYADTQDATNLAAAKAYTDAETTNRVNADNNLQNQISANNTVNLSDLAGSNVLPSGIQNVTTLQQTWRNLIKYLQANKANSAFVGYPTTAVAAELLMFLANDTDGNPVRVNGSDLFNRLLALNNVWTGSNTHRNDVSLQPTTGTDSPNLNFGTATGLQFSIDTINISGTQYLRVYDTTNGAPLLYINPNTGNVEVPRGGLVGQSGVTYGRKAIDGVYSFTGNRWNRIIQVGSTNAPWYIRGLLCIPNIHYVAEVILSNATGDGGVGAFIEYKTKGHYNYFGQYPSAVRVLAQATNGLQALDIKFPVATSANTLQFQVLEEYGTAARDYTVVPGATYAGWNVSRGLTFGTSGGITYNEFRMHASKAAGSTAAALSTANVWSAPAQENTGFGAT